MAPVLNLNVGYS